MTLHLSAQNHGFDFLQGTVTSGTVLLTWHVGALCYLQGEHVVAHAGLLPMWEKVCVAWIGCMAAVDASNLGLWVYANPYSHILGVPCHTSTATHHHHHPSTHPPTTSTSQYSWCFTHTPFTHTHAPS